MERSGRWKYFFAFTIVVDVIQIILYFIWGSGLVVNRFIAIGMVFILPLALEIAGIKPRWFVLLGVFTAEALPLSDLIPSWTIYIWLVKKGWEAEQLLIAEIPELGRIADLAIATKRKPLVRDGVRAPVGRDTM